MYLNGLYKRLLGIFIVIKLNIFAIPLLLVGADSPKFIFFPIDSVLKI